MRCSRRQNEAGNTKFLCGTVTMVIASLYRQLRELQRKGKRTRNNLIVTICVFYTQFIWLVHWNVDILYRHVCICSIIIICRFFSNMIMFYILDEIC